MTFALQVVQSSGAIAQKLMGVAPVCPVTLLSSGSAAGGTVTVTSGSGYNLYNYSVTLPASLSTAAYGTLTCALDPTGTGVIDLLPVPCSGGTTTQLVDQSGNKDIYSNYVGSRPVMVNIHQDLCNGTDSITSTNGLKYPEVLSSSGSPVALISNSGLNSGSLKLSGQYEFLSAEVSNSSSADPRLAGASFLATNYGGAQVQADGSNAAGPFSISSMTNYAQLYALTSSHQSFGVNIKNFTPNNSGGGTGSVTFSTDELGGQSSGFSLTKNDCTFANVGSTLLNIKSGTCQDGTAWQSYTVDFWGTYSCKGMSDGTNTLDLSGAFEGLHDVPASCPSGGGGSGGPVKVGA